jgi:hypothetical protein
VRVTSIGDNEGGGARKGTGEDEGSPVAGASEADT